MVVGTGLVELRIPGCGSLKEKRGVLSRIIRRTQNEFNISIAEVGDNDHWKKARIGFSVVGNEESYVNAKLDHVLRFIDGFGLAEAVRSRIEIMNLAELVDSGDFTGIEEGKYE